MESFEVNDAKMMYLKFNMYSLNTQARTLQSMYRNAIILLGMYGHVHIIANFSPINLIQISEEV